MFRRQRDLRPGPVQRIVALGDSSTWGYAVSAREKCLVNQVTTMLEEFQGSPIELINQGIGSNVLTTECPSYEHSAKPAALERVDAELIAYNPDLVFLSYGLLLLAYFTLIVAVRLGASVVGRLAGAWATGLSMFALWGGLYLWFARRALKDPEWGQEDYAAGGAREIVGLGTLFQSEGKPSLHFHAGIGRGDHAIVGCPREQATCFLILEVVVIEWLGLEAERIPDPRTGFRLLTLGKT